MSRSFKADYAFGKSQEQLILPRIRSHFSDTIEAEEDTFSISDFSGALYKYELKSRTTKYNEYPTTMIPAHKVNSENQIFLFNFTDGLYYIKYDPVKFATYDKKMFCRRARTDHKDVPRPYYYIPIVDLTKID
jgi:hypothetical protein